MEDTFIIVIQVNLSFLTSNRLRDQTLAAFFKAFEKFTYPS
jgi:hypothetical protein